MCVSMFVCCVCESACMYVCGVCMLYVVYMCVPCLYGSVLCMCVLCMHMYVICMCCMCNVCMCIYVCLCGMCECCVCSLRYVCMHTHVRGDIGMKGFEYQDTDMGHFLKAKESPSRPPLTFLRSPH